MFWGTHLSGGSLKSWDTRWGTPTSCCSGRSWELVKFPSPAVCPEPGVGLMVAVSQRLSYHFPVSCFLICPVYGNHSGSRFCLQEIVSYVAIDLVCPHRTASSRSSLCDYLEQEPSSLLFVLNFKKNLIPVLLILFESLKEMEIVPVHSMWPDPPPDKNSTKTVNLSQLWIKIYKY